MNVELQQLTVFENGFPMGWIWVGICNNAVIETPDYPMATSAKEAEESVRETVEQLMSVHWVEFSIHPQCQTKQNKKDRRNN